MGQTLALAWTVSEYNVRHWTSSDLRVALREANACCAQLGTKSDKTLQFKEVKPCEKTRPHEFPESGFIWRFSVRVQPYFRFSDGHEAPCGKVLSLGAFVCVYRFITETCQQGNCPPAAMSRLPGALGAGAEDRCAICYENLPDEVLPCTHSFCKSCIDEWGSINATCPMCRETVPEENERFVNVAKPSMTEVHEYLISSFQQT